MQQCYSIKNINLALPQTGIIFITGKSDCGKSNLCMINKKTLDLVREKIIIILKFIGEMQMEEFKGIGYKNSYSIWILLTGSIISFILTAIILFLRQNDFIIYAILFLALAVIFLISFIIEKKRPDIVVFLSDSSIKILKGFKWKIISFDDIDYVDYQLNVLKRTQAILFEVGNLIIENKNQKFVVRDVENVKDCYEKIMETLREYRNTKNSQT